MVTMYSATLKGHVAAPCGKLLPISNNDDLIERWTSPEACSLDSGG